MNQKDAVRKGILAVTAAAVLAVNGAMAVLAAEQTASAITIEEASESAAGALVELGTITDERKELSVSGLITKEAEDGSAVLYSALGTAVAGSEHLQAKALDPEQQYFVLMKKGELAASCALYRADGTELIPYGAAVINLVYGSDRYVQVCYIEEKTDDKAEAIVYSSDKFFSLSPDEGDQLFKGCWQIYDLKNQKFVENLNFTSPLADVRASDGDALYVIGEDGSSANAKIVDCNGSVLCENAGSIILAGQFYFERVSGGVICYDSGFHRLFETPNTVNAIGSREDYIQCVKDGMYCLMDTDGTVVLETGLNASFDGTKESDLFIAAEDVNNDYNYSCGLMNPDGSLLVDCQYNSVSYCGNGYFIGMTRTEDGYSRDILSETDGIVCENAENFDSTCMTAYRESETSRMYYVIKDRDYTLELKHAASIGFGLVKAQDDNGMWGLFETENGTQLLDYAYMDIQTAYGKVYAYRDGSYTVYDWN